jgi:hypothetical protein
MVLIMAIGDDIKTVLQELGTPITIHKPDGTVIPGEFIDYDMYFEQSTEFIRQNCYSGDFAFDTQADFGDVLDVDGIFMMVMNAKATKFEQESVITNCFLIEMNCLGKFQRQTETRVNMERQVTWVDTVINARGLQIDGSKTSFAELTEEVDVLAERDTLYLPQYANIRIGDRWLPDQTNPNEYYRVATMVSRAYKNCYKIALTQDNRE